MDTVSVLTLRLAEAMGLYMILIGIGGLASPSRWRAVMDDLHASPALVVTLGFAVFVVGMTLVMIHSIWTDPLAVIVSIIGYIALIEGALLLTMPAPLIHMGHSSSRFIRAWAGIALVLGIFLFFAGLTGRATILV